MATIEALIARTRLELADVKRPFYEVLSSAGGSQLDLKQEHISSLYLYPKGDPESLIDPETYRIDSAAGRVFFEDPPEYGTMIVAEGEATKLFSDEDMQVFVQSAFAKHTSSRDFGTHFGRLPDVEDHLVAILAAIEALWVLLTSAAYDINIHAPEGMFVPRAQRFQQIRELLQMLEGRYRELCNALGVGLYTVEMFNLRRVSKRTGRLVPVYVAQEIDDTRPAKRVFPPISSMGAPLADPTTPVHNLQVYQGRPFEQEFVLYDEEGATEPLDLTGEGSFLAELFLHQYAVTSGRHDILPKFALTVSPEEGVVTLKLSAEETGRMETNGSYVWQLIWDVDHDDPMPLMAGNVLVEGGLPKKNANVQVR